MDTPVYLPDASRDTYDRFTQGRLYQIYKSQTTYPKNIDYEHIAIKHIQDVKAKHLRRRRVPQSNGWDEYCVPPDSWLDSNSPINLTVFYIGRLYQFILQTNKRYTSGKVLQLFLKEMIDLAIRLRVEYMPSRIDKEDYDDHNILRCMDCDKTFHCGPEYILSDWCGGYNSKGNYCGTCNCGLELFNPIDEGIGV